MEKFHVLPKDHCPEILLSPDDNVFLIKGISRPEDIREVFYPVIKWMTEYRDGLQKENNMFNEENPLIWQFDLEYFNSSSAKFLFDMVNILKSIHEDGTPVTITWIYDSEDTDNLEAGEDLAYLAEIDFLFLKRQERE